MNKPNFVKIMDSLDEYYNGDTMKAFNLLGICENSITAILDDITEAISAEMDPDRLARSDSDPEVRDCGSYVVEWLFGNSEFQEKCKTAGELYDYIKEQYKNVKEA